ncbi:hypothetical protein OH492_12590 [Vibrio chagasii]|nr:hypothetical protein [Vibrio chagasii]
MLNLATTMDYADYKKVQKNWFLTSVSDVNPGYTFDNTIRPSGLGWFGFC